MPTWMRIVPTTDPAPTLFVVDDDVATQELLCEIAHDAGWSTRGFSCLTDLRRSLDTATPTLLILDDDARELRTDERMADLPTLVGTAAHPMRQVEIGAWAPVIAKPFDLAEIEAFLGAAARRHSPPDAHGRRAG